MNGILKGNPETCWNEKVVRAHVTSVNNQERQARRAGEELVVLSGQMACNGCEIVGERRYCTLLENSIPSEILPEKSDQALALKALQANITGFRVSLPLAQ
jgi:hypothetical protein